MPAVQSTPRCSAPRSISAGRRMKRRPTHPAAPGSAAQLTQGADGETFTSFTGTILQNLLQCAALAGYTRQEEQEGGSTGSFCLPCLHLWLAPTHTSSPARWPCSMKHCFGNSGSSVASTGRWCGNASHQVSGRQALLCQVLFKRQFILKPQARSLSPLAQDN